MKKITATTFSEKKFTRDSFTIVELLIVVGIIGILAVATVVVLNPFEYIKESRDAVRINDLESINKALTVLEAQGHISFGDAGTAYVSVADDASSTCGSLGLPALPFGYEYHCVSSTTLRNVDGTGWIPVDFQSSLSLSFSLLPIDPLNTTSSYYLYIPGGSWELNAFFESQKYRLSGNKDKTSADGGDSLGVYEVGSNKTLSPLKDSDLIGYWDFEEGSGSVVYDKTNSGFDGTWYGTGSHYGTGKVGAYAGKFNTPTITSDYVLLPSEMAASIHGGTEASLTMWVKLDSDIPDSSTKQGLIQLSGHGSTNGSFYPYTTGFLYLDIFRITRLGFSRSDLLSNWHFLSVTTQPGTNGWKVYLNGKIIYQSTGEATVSTNYANTTIGLNSVSRRTLGFIDEVRVYNRALSPAEVVGIYNATK